jgi:hypothetical protein
MAEITFHANDENLNVGTEGTLIEHTGGSGLGFFGAGFGISVPVGQRQDTTFVTNGDGTEEGARVQNTKYMAAGTASFNGAAAQNNETLPNRYAPLNIRFTHTEPVRVQNCKLRIFNRSNIDTPAVGVDTYVYEVRHPYPLAASTDTVDSTSSRGVSDHNWVDFEATDTSVADMSFVSSPGVSGLNTVNNDPVVTTYPDGTGVGDHLVWLSNSGSLLRETRHDWYVALSAEPDSIGSKTEYGLYFTLEYL